MSPRERSERSDQEGARRLGFNEADVTRGIALLRDACQLMNVAAAVIVTCLLLMARLGSALTRSANPTNLS